MYKLFKTASFRLIFLSVSFFILAEVVIGLIIYQRVFSLYVQKNDVNLIKEFFYITGVSNVKNDVIIPRYTISSAFSRVQSRISNTGYVYALVNKNDEIVVGNLSHLPDDIEDKKSYFNFEIETDNLFYADKKSLNFRGIYIKTFTPDYQPYYKVLIAYDNTQLTNLKNKLLNDLFLLTFITLFIGISLGIIISRLIIVRIDRLSSRLSKIIYNDISGRLKISNTGDEIDYLSDKINFALDKLETLMKNVKAVGDNIAHDLKSPLTRLKYSIEQIGEAEDDKSRKKIIVKSKKELDSILLTFNSLLSISRLRSGEELRDKVEISLKTIAEEIFELYEPLLQEKNIKILTFIESEENILGSKELMSQVFSNFIENILNYATGANYISLMIKKINDEIILIFQDDGPGIDEIHYENIFDRFVRLESSRNKKGFGLGLSLVKAIIYAHNGSIKAVKGLKNSSGGYGLGYEIKLPCNS